ncbi:MAG: hypothetical protein D6729_12260 [Deltaproteobacteria bacterium]|nr:MAG: hypothetical protein D6729_12260 [Deltaproteobacteria bacterium]
MKQDETMWTDKREQGGYTLIVTLILLAVLLVVGAAAVKMAGSEVRGAIGAQKQEMMVNCAQAAREYLLSQLRWGAPMPQADPATGKIDPKFTFELMDPADPAKPILQLNKVGANKGHVPGVVPQIERIEFHNDATLGKSSSGPVGVQITNNIPGPQGAGGGVGARITVLCSVPDPRDPVNNPPLRSQEVEMLVRYGI